MTKRRARSAIVGAARSLLDGSGQAIEICRAILSLSIPAELEDNEALDVIRGVEAQTEYYPLGDLHEKYAPEYLRRVEAETETFLSQMRPSLEEACRDLMNRLAGPRPV